jgi:hypothetical protein
VSLHLEPDRGGAATNSSATPIGIRFVVYFYYQIILLDSVSAQTPAVKKKIEAEKMKKLTSFLQQLEERALKRQ